jgi:hypothetical protein
MYYKENTSDDFPNLKIEDEIVCQNYRTLNSNYLNNNNDLFAERTYVPCYYKQFKSIDDDNELYHPKFERVADLCDKNVVFYRGENNKPQSVILTKQEFLIPYCKCNTYDNGIICDSKKCCSKSHQLFGNMTRRNQQMMCKSSQPKLCKR